MKWVVLFTVAEVIERKIRIELAIRITRNFVRERRAEVFPTLEEQEAYRRPCRTNTVPFEPIEKSRNDRAIAKETGTDGVERHDIPQAPIELDVERDGEASPSVHYARPLSAMGSS